MRRRWKRSGTSARMPKLPVLDEYPDGNEPPEAPGAKSSSYENQIGRMIPKGPYKTKGERFNAIAGVLKLNQTRMINGYKPVSDDTLWRHCKFTYDEVYNEASDPNFRDMRMARAKGELGDGLVDVIGIIRWALRKQAEDVLANPKDEKKREKFLNTSLQFAEKYGIYEVDSNKANQNQELDSDQ